MPLIILIHPEGNISNNPNLLGIVDILCEKGYQVDIYSRRRSHLTQEAPCRSSRFIATDIEDSADIAVLFPRQAELTPESVSSIRNAFTGCSLVIGVDMGIIEAARLAGICNVPYGLISYEIYFGEETGHEFKLPEMEACRGVSFAVCQDRLRSAHLSRENGVPLGMIIDIPVAGRSVACRERSYALHEALGIDRTRKIALYIGEATSKWAGFDELLESTESWDDSWVLVLHHRYGQMGESICRRLENSSRVYRSPFPSLAYADLSRLLNAADLGVAFYLPQMESPIFQERNNLRYIGMASGKIATYLQHGLPILINEIGEMSDYVRQFGLGAVVSKISETGAVLKNVDRHIIDSCSAMASSFFHRHLDLDRTIEPLLGVIGDLHGVKSDAGANSIPANKGCISSAAAAAQAIAGRFEVMKQRLLPKISIITPSYNQAQYLEECIDSILSQNYSNLEYIIMDGGSTDGSVDIIKKYEKHLSFWQSQPDGGQYAAINEGFQRSTGEIMAWLNSDDKYHAGALHLVELAFRAMPQTEWITGRPTAWDDCGNLTTVFDHVPSWSFERLLYHGKDDYYVQQESTFWRRSLWDRAGGKLDTHWQLAADFELWCRFFHHTRLVGVDALIGGFRYHGGQKTGSMMDRYEQEVLQIIDQERSTAGGHQVPSRPPQVVGMEEIVSAATPKLTPDVFSYFSYSRRPHFAWLETSAKELFGTGVHPDYCDLKMYQDLLCYTFITENLPKGSRILEVGGCDSRVLKALKHEYECWNVDKLEGLGNGLTQVTPDGYRMIRAYLGDFSEELPDGYFNFVFSISALEHVEENDRNFNTICRDMDRVMKPGAYSLHCFDVIAKSDSVWTNGLLPFLYRRYETISRLTPFEQMVRDPSLYCMSESAYCHGWINITREPYKDFGRPLSCNILWQKPTRQPDGMYSNPQGKQTITVATSIAPQNLDIQQQAIASWACHGFNIISVNTSSEIAILKDRFKSVTFVEAFRNAADLFQKPLIYLDDIFAALQSAGSSICGIINADIHLMQNTHLADFVFQQAKDSFLFGSRCDVNSLDEAPEDLFLKGRDYFFFDRSFIPRFKGTNFCLGAPWWDIWLPFAVMGAGVRPKQIQEKIAKHVRHDIRWDQDDCWNRCGKLFVEYFQRAGLPIMNDKHYARLESDFIHHGNGLPFAVFVTDYLMSLTDWVSLDKWGAEERGRALFVEPAKRNSCVTAIVSTYNSEQFIRGCLEDLTTQTLFVKGQLEIVIIDSASQQNEESIVRTFIERFGTSIVYLRTSRRETIYQAWNRAILSASGRYITNANTDDRHRIDALELMAATLDANPDIALVYGDCLVTNFPNQIFEHAIRCGYHIRPEYAPEIMLSGCHMGPQPMWRKNVHDEIGYFSEEISSAGDYDFWCRIALKHKLMHIPQFLGLYYENPKGFANSDTGLSVRESRQIQLRYEGLFPAPQRDYSTNFQYWQETAECDYVHICVVTRNDMPSFNRMLESLVRCTEYPHVITVVGAGNSEEMRRFLEAAKAAGLITNLLFIDGSAPLSDAVAAADILEQKAACRLLLGYGMLVSLPGWLSLLIKETERFPAARVMANRIWTRNGVIRSMDGLLPAFCLEDNPAYCFRLERPHAGERQGG